MGNPISFPWNYLQFQKKFLFHMQMKRASLKYLGGEKKKRQKGRLCSSVSSCQPGGWGAHLIYRNTTIHFPATSSSTLEGICHPQETVFSFLRKVVLICQVHMLLCSPKMQRDPDNKVNVNLLCEYHSVQWFVITLYKK